jgi:hypothetical protein
MSSNIDLSKITYETNDILERFYKETPLMNIMTAEDFNNIPLNENYKKNKEKAQEIQETTDFAKIRAEHTIKNVTYFDSSINLNDEINNASQK